MVKNILKIVPGSLLAILLTAILSCFLVIPYCFLLTPDSIFGFVGKTVVLMIGSGIALLMLFVICHLVNSIVYAFSHVLLIKYNPVDRHSDTTLFYHFKEGFRTMFFYNPCFNRKIILLKHGGCLYYKNPFYYKVFGPVEDRRGPCEEVVEIRKIYYNID